VQLKYKRQQWSGTYYASTDTHTVAIDKIGSGWDVRVWTKNPSNIIKYSPGYPNMASAKVFAQSFIDDQEV
jgi:hypothetical protein